MKKCILLLSLGAVASLAGQSAAAQNQTEITETHTITQTFKFGVGSKEARSAIHWLRDRQGDGQLPADEDPKRFTGVSFISGTIEVVSKHTGQAAEAGIGQSNSVSALGGGGAGVDLPRTGKDGQTITITSCTRHDEEVTYTYIWVKDSAGGHWELQDEKLHRSSSIICN